MHELVLKVVYKNQYQKQKVQMRLICTCMIYIPVYVG